MLTAVHFFHFFVSNMRLLLLLLLALLLLLLLLPRASCAEEQDLNHPRAEPTLELADKPIEEFPANDPSEWVSFFLLPSPRGRSPSSSSSSSSPSSGSTFFALASRPRKQSRTHKFWMREIRKYFLIWAYFLLFLFHSARAPSLLGCDRVRTLALYMSTLSHHFQ